MTTTNLKQFFTSENIPNYLICYYTTIRQDGKVDKKPIGEKNNDTLERVNNKKNNNPPKPITYTKINKEGGYDEIALTETEKQTLQKTYTCFLKHTPNIFCVDIDMHEITTMEEFIEQTDCVLFQDCPYTKGNTKGIHIFVNIKDMVEYSCQIDVYKNFKGDLLRVNNVWERTGKEVYNYNGNIPEIDFNDIKNIFNEKINRPTPTSTSTTKILVIKKKKAVAESSPESPPESPPASTPARIRKIKSYVKML